MSETPALEAALKLTLTDEQIAELLALSTSRFGIEEISGGDIRALAEEVLSRRAAEKKEWRLMHVSGDPTAPMSESTADEWVSQCPQLYRKQHRFVSIGPWIDADEPASAGKEGK